MAYFSPSSQRKVSAVATSSATGVGGGVHDTPKIVVGCESV